MKLAFSTLGCHEFTLNEIIAAAVKYGFDGVELRHVEKTVRLWETEDLKPSALGEAKKKFDGAGLEVSAVGASGSFAAPDKAARAKQLDDLKRWAETAAALSSPYLRVFGGPVPEGQTLEETIKLDIEGYNEAALLLAGSGVTLLLETHDSFSTSRAMLPLVEKLKGNFGVLWDILHPLRFGESVEETWNKLKPYIKYLHIKDSLVFSEKDFDFMLMGEGRVPVPRIVELLKGGGYNGYLSFEWERGWHPEIPPCERAFPHFVNYMKKLLA